jgi:hypothetical protein
MPILVKIALYGWTPLVLWLFARLPARRALLLGVIGGTLFLPEVQLAKVSEEAPDASEFMLLILKLTKPNAISFAAVLGAFLFDRRRVLSFRPRWFDLPMFIWCISPMFSDLNIGVAFYESFSAARDQTLIWGILYFLGRVYFTDLESMRELALGLVLGGLITLPFALYEIRFSPQLHERVYGFFPGSKNEFDRMGGFRPIMFLSHGLALGMWLVATALTATCLWWSGAVSRMTLWPWRRTVPMFVPALALTMAAVLARSTGAIGIGLAGLAALLQLRLSRVPVLLVLLLALSPLYIAARTWGWSAAEVTTWVGSNVAEERANSFLYRVNQENRLIKKVQGQPLLGYGDTGLARKVEKEKRDDDPEAVTDSLWIICLSCYGYLGLIACWTAMLLPVARFLWLYPARWWDQAGVASAAAVALVLLSWVLDNLSNAMINPVFILCAGALAGMPVPRVATRQVPRAELPAVRRPGVLVRQRPGS